MMNPTQVYIAVEGVIGVGKTTLARMFQQAIGGQLVLEVFEENPFLSDFYTDRARYAFQTQIFFLLSRYHQQRELAKIARPLVSDYMFEKDRLFAQVNLTGDELETYLSVHEALAEAIGSPDLVVFLRADTATLMNRITNRDRPYERNMETAYIDRLRVAYEEFFATYGAAPVLTIDTNALDFVHDEEARASIFDRIRGALGAGPRQPALPGLNDSPPPVTAPAAERDAAEKSGPRLAELQRLHRHLDAAQPLTTDPLLDFITLQETIGTLAGAVARRWLDSTAPQAGPVVSPLRDELAAVLASLVKLANDAGVDLEDACGERLRRLGRATQTGAGGDGEHT